MYLINDQFEASMSLYMDDLVKFLHKFLAAASHLQCRRVYALLGFFLVVS